jgi:hypothetical protein
MGVTRQVANETAGDRLAAPEAACPRAAMFAPAREN